MGFQVFLKVPVIIIILFCESNVLRLTHINILYTNFVGRRGGGVGCEQGLLYILRLLFIKTENLQEHNLS